MKRFLVLVMAVVSLVFFGGCSPTGSWEPEDRDVISGDNPMVAMGRFDTDYYDGTWIIQLPYAMHGKKIRVEIDRRIGLGWEMMDTWADTAISQMAYRPEAGIRDDQLGVYDPTQALAWFRYRIIIYS